MPLKKTKTKNLKLHCPQLFTTEMVLVYLEFCLRFENYNQRKGQQTQTKKQIVNAVFFQEA